jgi:DNA helicase HerA-like ATPase
MESSELVKRLFLPDGGSYSLSTAISARSGAGKSTLITGLVNLALKMPEFGNTRFIYVSVKGEHLWEVEHRKFKPVSDIGALHKQMNKFPISVYYPSDPAEYENDVNDVIEYVFSVAEVNPEASFNIIIDDANVITGFDSFSRPSSSIKKLAIAGRSRGVRGCFVTHRLGNLPRMLNGNLSGLVLMTMNLNDSEYGERVFGMDFKPLLSGLGDYRWAYVDLIDERMFKFDPLYS